MLSPAWSRKSDRVVEADAAEVRDVDCDDALDRRLCGRGVDSLRRVRASLHIGAYDTRSEIAIEGLVTQFHFVSPHPFVIAEVVRNGAAEQWPVRYGQPGRNARHRRDGGDAARGRPGRRRGAPGPRRVAARVHSEVRADVGWAHFDIVDRRPRLIHAPAR